MSTGSVAGWNRSAWASWCSRAITIGVYWPRRDDRLRGHPPCPPIARSTDGRSVTDITPWSAIGRCRAISIRWFGLRGPRPCVSWPDPAGSSCRPFRPTPPDSTSSRRRPPGVAARSRCDASSARVLSCSIWVRCRAPPPPTPCPLTRAQGRPAALPIGWRGALEKAPTTC